MAGLATFVNTSNTGTLGVAGLARFVNTSNSGTLGIAGQTTLTGSVGIGKAPTANALDVNGTVNATTFVGNLNGNATTATTATYAQSLISGGSLIPGINTPGSIIINSNSNKIYASARLYVDGNTIVSGDVTLRSDGAGTVIIGSNNATTSMSLNGDLSITGRIYTYFYHDYAGNTAPRIQTVNGGGTYFNTISTNENAFTFLYGSTAANLSSDTTNRVAVIDSNGSLRIGLKKPITTNIFDGWGGSRLQWGSTQYGDTRIIAPDNGLDQGGACVFYAGGRERIILSANGVISLKANVNAEYAITCASLTASGDITAYSDQRAKENIVTIDSPLDKIMKMRGVYYTRKDMPERKQRHIGVIAQEVEEVLPEVVLTDTTENKNKSVAYGNIVALLIEGMKEQQKIIEGQQSTINSLLTRI